jgi:hypothetical protein
LLGKISLAACALVSSIFLPRASNSVCAAISSFVTASLLAWLNVFSLSCAAFSFVWYSEISFSTSVCLVLVRLSIAAAAVFTSDKLAKTSSEFTFPIFVGHLQHSVNVNPAVIKIL